MDAKYFMDDPNQKHQKLASELAACVTTVLFGCIVCYLCASIWN